MLYTEIASVAHYKEIVHRFRLRFAKLVFRLYRNTKDQLEHYPVSSEAKFCELFSEYFRIHEYIEI